MRPVLLTFGVVLLVLGILVGAGGAGLRGVGETCVQNPRCTEGDFYAMYAAGQAMTVGGTLVGLVGLALFVVGVTQERAPKRVAVRAYGKDGAACARCATVAPDGARFCPDCGLAFFRKCPSCDADLPREATRCDACRASVAPLAPPLAR